MFQIEKNKQYSRRSRKYKFLLYTSSIYVLAAVEQPGFLKESFDLVSTSAPDAMGTLGMAPQDGMGCVWNCVWDWTPARSLLLPSPPNRVRHGWTNPRRTIFHRTNASSSLPETRSTYYLLLLDLSFASPGA